MRNPFLSDDELRTLTGKRLHSAQRRTLNFMGIPHKVRPDGSVVVLWSHVAGVSIPGYSKPDTEPNWRAI